jgi:GTPase SAR1 family protein
VGSSGAGKSTLKTILENSNDFPYTHTVQLDMSELEYSISGKPVSVQIWDTTPAMAYRQLIHDFSKTAHVAIVVLSGCICRYDENFEKEYEEFVSNLNSDCRIIFVITGEHSPIQMNKVMHFVKNILIGETLKKRTDGLYIFPDLSEDEVNKCRIEVNKMIETAIKNYGYEKLPENAQGMHGRIVERDVNKYVNNRYIMERKYELECY